MRAKQALVIRHVPFEGPGAIGEWLQAKGYELTHAHLHQDDPLPDPAGLDWLVVMGGPMGVNDRDTVSFLPREIAFLKSALTHSYPVVGICLGAQLLAHCLDAEVRYQGFPEIGWFPIAPASDHPLAQLFSDQPEVLHWHGDTFNLPDGAQPLLRSEACANQGFLWQHNVLALQCHPEATAYSLNKLCDAEGGELTPSQWVQDVHTIRAGEPRCPTINQRLFAMLDWLESQQTSN